MNDLQTFIFGRDQFRRARLPSLYSDFHIQQNTNPDGYTANITAWVSGLAQAAFAGKVAGGKDRFSLKMDQDLLQALETKEWGRPMALGAVVFEAVSQGQMIPSQTFLTASASILDRSWKTTPWNIIAWSLRQLGLVSAASVHHPLREGQMVLLENLELASQKVQSALSSRIDRVERVLPLKTFESEVNSVLGLGTGLSSLDLKVLLVYMSRDTKQILYNAKVVKLRDPQDNVPVISATDESIASLQLLMADMTTQQSIIISRIAELSAKVRDAVSMRNRSLAASALRSKKNHETLYKSKSDNLIQLENVYLKLVEALDQTEVVRVMQESTSVLRNIHNSMGGVEAVEEVVEGLREEMDKVDDISNTISGDANAHIIDEEIDSELQELEMKQKEDDEQKQSKERQKELELLPPVPNRQGKMESKSADEILEDSAVALVEKAIHRLSIENDQGNQVPTSTQENRNAAQNAVNEPA